MVLPALALYEIMGIFLYHDRPVHVRNGIDVLINRWLFAWGPSGNLIIGFGLAMIIGGLGIKYRKTLAGGLRSVYFGVMALESMAWATLFLVLSALTIPKMLALPSQGNFAELLYLSLGAGIFEEFLFRFILVSGLFYLFNRVFRETKFRAALAAVLISGLVFSIFHYLGYFGEAFRWRSFTYRFVSGVFLSILFLKRGFGITAYTHIFYDVILVSMPVILN